MKRSEKQLEKIVCKSLEKKCGEYVDRDIELLASGVIGSFQLFELICDLEEAFGIRFRQEDLRELNHFSSVKTIVDLIKKYELMER